MISIWTIDWIQYKQHLLDFWLNNHTYRILLFFSHKNQQTALVIVMIINLTKLSSRREKNIYYTLIIWNIMIKFILIILYMSILTHIGSIGVFIWFFYSFSFPRSFSLSSVTHSFVLSQLVIRFYATSVYLWYEYVVCFLCYHIYHHQSSFLFSSIYSFVSIKIRLNIVFSII